MNGVRNELAFDGIGALSENGDFETNIDYTTLDVSIKESSGPLVKVDKKWRNSILSKVEVKKQEQSV